VVLVNTAINLQCKVNHLVPVKEELVSLEIIRTYLAEQLPPSRSHCWIDTIKFPNLVLPGHPNAMPLGIALTKCAEDGRICFSYERFNHNYPERDFKTILLAILFDKHRQATSLS
jgi:hypothetical protein